MRKAIYDYLSANCQSINQWFDGYQEGIKEKPYGVIIMGEETPSTQSTSGAFEELYIWPYLEAGAFIPVDQAVSEIKQLLKNRLLTTDNGAVFLIEYVQTGKDFYDEDLAAFTRRIDFRIPKLR